MGWSHVSLLPNRLSLNSKIAQNASHSTASVPASTSKHNDDDTIGTTVMSVFQSEENRRKMLDALTGTETGTGTPAVAADDGDSMLTMKPDPSLASLITVETTKA